MIFIFTSELFLQTCGVRQQGGGREVPVMTTESLMADLLKQKQIKAATKSIPSSSGLLKLLKYLLNVFNFVVQERKLPAVPNVIIDILQIDTEGNDPLVIQVKIQNNSLCSSYCVTYDDCMPISDNNSDDLVLFIDFLCLSFFRCLRVVITC